MSRHRPRVPGMRAARGHLLHLRPTPPANASAAVALGAELRAAAELADCCICGAEAQFFEVLKYGADPAVRRLENPLASGVTHVVFVHRADCPAASPAVEAALAPSTEEKNDSQAET